MFSVQSRLWVLRGTMIWRWKTYWGGKEKHNEEDCNKQFKRNKAELFRKKMQVTMPCVFVHACICTGASSNFWTCFSAVTLGGGRSEKQLSFCSIHESIWSRIGEASLQAVLTARSIVIWSIVRAIMWGVTLVTHRGSIRTWRKDLKNVLLYMGRNLNQSSQLVRHRSQSTMKHKSIGD